MSNAAMVAVLDAVRPASVSSTSKIDVSVVVRSGPASAALLFGSCNTNVGSTWTWCATAQLHDQRFARPRTSSAVPDRTRERPFGTGHDSVAHLVDGRSSIVVLAGGGSVPMAA